MPGGIPIDRNKTSSMRSDATVERSIEDPDQRSLAKLVHKPAVINFIVNPCFFFRSAELKAASKKLVENSLD